MCALFRSAWAMFSSYMLSQRPWIPCKLHRILPLLLLLEITEILAACLPNATEASERKNLRTGTESYPVGLWPGGGWTAAQLTAKATQIIIEDTVVWMGRGPAKVVWMVTIGRGAVRAHAQKLTNLHGKSILAGETWVQCGAERSRSCFGTGGRWKCKKEQQWQEAICLGSWSIGVARQCS